jgi:hypothetical protein
MIRKEFVLEMDDEETFLIRPNGDGTVSTLYIECSGLGSVWRISDLRGGIISLGTRGRERANDVEVDTVLQAMTKAIAKLVAPDPASMRLVVTDETHDGGTEDCRIPTRGERSGVNAVVDRKVQLSTIGQIATDTMFDWSARTIVLR